MKKISITVILCLVTLVWVIAQTKKSPAVQQSIKRGEQVYMKTCIVCHQRDGGGVPRLNPPLIQTEYVLGDQTRLIQIVLKGLNETIEIENEEYTNAMPSFAQLTDQQIADVLTFVRSNFGNNATPVTVAKVKAVRAITK